MSRDPTWRTPEIEERSNLYVIHPISTLLVRRFAAWDIKPNTVSVLGALSAVVAAACFYNYQTWYMSLLGFMFMVGWHILDGADGQLARFTGTTTDFGKLLDGVCDQLGFLSIYLAITLAIQPVYGAWVWLLCLVAAFSHLAQAVSLEFQRDMYDCWVHQKGDKCVVPLQTLKKNVDQRTGVHRLMAIGYLFYTGLQHKLSELRPELLTMEQETRERPQQREQLAVLYRDYNLRLIHRWSWFSANKRTAAITLACLAQFPILFFVHEILILNTLLWGLKRRQRDISSQLTAVMSRQFNPTAED